MNGKTIENAIAYINGLFKDNFDGHDSEHTLRVYKNALLIAESYPDCNIDIISLSALLHDADDRKLFNTENNENARAFLEKENVDNSEIEEICEIINSVSFSKNRGVKPKTLEGMIVQDADRLDAMGAVGIARTFAYGGKNNRSLNSSVEHFHDKLLLLKDEMNTAPAQKMAEKRHEFLLSFLDELNSEL